MDASENLLRGVVRRWPLILLTVLVAAGAAFAFTETQPDEYRATSRLLVGPPTDAPVDTLRAAGLISHTYTDVVRSQRNLLGAAETVGLEPDLEELSELVEVTTNENTRMLTVTVQHEDPQIAADYADALLERIVTAAPVPIPILSEIIDEADRGLPAGMVTVVDDASTPPQPVEQPSLLLVLLAAIVGGAIAVTAAVALEAAPWRRPPPNLDGLVQRRFLGRFLLPSTGAGSALFRRGLNKQAAREQQLVTTKIQHLTSGRPFRSLCVVGGRADGDSARVGSDLASNFAQQGRSVVLVDLTGDRDLQRRLRPDRREREVVTVGDVVLELADVGGAADGRLRLLVSDTVRHQDTPRARHVVELLGEVADLVVVVAPAMLLEFGSLLVAQRTDGALLVGAEDPESVDGLIEAHDLLGAHGVTVVGSVLASRHSGVDYRALGNAGAAVGPGTAPADPRRLTGDSWERTGGS